jgi:uncharacterized membrane protein
MPSSPADSGSPTLDASSDGDAPAGVLIRQVIAVAAFANALVATYLHLWKRGLMGPLSCGPERGCEVVQLSSWGWFLGVDVALIGAIGYTLIFGAALLGLRDGNEWARWPTLVLAALIYPAFLFTLRLKYAEFIILKSFCPWCAISAVTITVLCLLVALDWRRVSRPGTSI